MKPRGMAGSFVIVCIALGGIGFAQTESTVWSGIFTDAQAGQGETLYAASCASCHGADLRGGEMAPPLVGGEFMSAWNDVPLSDLLQRMNTSMPQDAPGSLSRDQDADILAYVLKRNSYPSGSTPLPATRDALEKWKLLATRP